MKTINFSSLKKVLKEGVEASYLLSGKDFFLLDYSVKLIVDACDIAFPELNLIKLGDGDVNCSDVVRILSTVPFGSEKKVVLINTSVKTGNITNLKDLEEYLKNPLSSSILILCAGENESFSKLAGISTTVSCDRLEDSFILSFVAAELKKHGKEISRVNGQKLNEFCMSDMMHISSELAKLISYIGDRKEITEQDLNDVVIKKEEYQIFELSEALGKKDAEKVYRILSNFKTKKDGVKFLLPLISNHFRRLFFVSITGGDRRSLSTNLGVKEFAVTKYMAQVKNFTKRQLKEIVDLCNETEFAIKTGKRPQDSSVEYIILKILNV